MLSKPAPGLWERPKRATRTAIYGSAGLLLRQATERNGFTMSQMVLVEMLLRQYGVTSAGIFRHLRQDHLNVQGSFKGGILDFGSYLVLEDFTKPAACDGAKDSLKAYSGEFVRPNRGRRVPLRIWGHTLTGREDPQADNLWIWAHQLADAFRLGLATKKQVEDIVLSLIQSGLSFEPSFQSFADLGDLSWNWIENILCYGFTSPQ